MGGDETEICGFYISGALEGEMKCRDKLRLKVPSLSVGLHHAFIYHIVPHANILHYVIRHQ